VVTIGRAVDLTRYWRDRRELSTGEVLLWAWSVVVIGFFSLARFKLDHYIFPAAPACCLLAAHAWLRAVGNVRSMATRISILAMGISLIGIGLVAGVALTRIDLGLPLGAAMLPATSSETVRSWSQAVRRLASGRRSPARSRALAILSYRHVAGRVCDDRTRRASTFRANASDKIHRSCAENRLG
jgi:4-amino-4-deoxy-L-arabinose transferase-like glycosyltransferase